MNELFITLQKKFSKVNNPKNNFLTVLTDSTTTAVNIFIFREKILKKGYFYENIS